MKRVLIAIGKLSGGGAERVASVWANELVEKGYEVAILTYFSSENEYYCNECIRVYRIAETQKEYIGLSFLSRYNIIRGYLKSFTPEYVISFLPSMQIWMMLTNVGLRSRRIETIRINPWKANVKGIKQKILWRMCYTTCHKVIFQSSDQAPFFSKRQQRKSIVIPNPLSDVYFENHRTDITNAPRKFVAAGRITEQKNYPMMIKAFANVCKNHPEITLDIYGEGNEIYVSQIRELISTVGMDDRIILCGRSNCMENEYKSHDVFLMSSDYEGLPNALAEAMASRLVIISTDCKTGPRDLIDDGRNGFLVPIDNIDALQQKLEEVISMSPEKLNEIAKNARKKVLNYCSRRNSVERLCSILK